MFLGILPRLEYDKDEIDHSSFSIVLLNKLTGTPLSVSATIPLSYQGVGFIK